MEYKKNSRNFKRLVYAGLLGINMFMNSCVVKNFYDTGKVVNEKFDKNNYTIEISTLGFNQKIYIKIKGNKKSLEKLAGKIENGTIVRFPVGHSEKTFLSDVTVYDNYINDDNFLELNASKIEIQKEE